jgi:predicted ribosome quality control (RQC) complex YloA/Tae2 family protein
MQKLPAVEEAKELLTAAKDWGVWKWLTEKSRVRQTADRAWEALDEYEKKVRAAWSDDLQKAYQELMAQAALDGNAKTKRQLEKAQEAAQKVDPKIKAAAKRLKQADDEAYALRMQAEETFDEAEKRMSTSMACEGSRQAVEAWEVREKFIRKCETAGRAS